MAEPIVPTVPIQAVPISNTPYAQVMTPTEANQIVNQYGINPQQVLSGQNIQQTVTAPVPRPDDLLGIRSQIYGEQGVGAAQAAYQTAQKAASSAALGLQERLTGLRGRAVSLSKITGTQAQERAVSQGEIDALNESARIAQSDYLAKKGNADEMFQIRNQEITEKKQVMLQYPGAKITFGDSMDQVTQKLDTYAQQQKKDAYKDALKAEALKLGITKTNISTKELEKKIAKRNKQAVADAKKERDLKLKQIEVDIENTKSTIANRGKEKISTAEQYVQDKQDSMAELNAVRGADGRVDPIDYNRLKSAWSIYNDPSKFDENFQQYINKDRIDDYNVTQTNFQLQK